MRIAHLLTFVFATTAIAVAGGPYSAGSDDPDNAFDAPVPGLIQGQSNPLFFGWATDWENYERSDEDTQFSDPDFAIGPATGNEFHVVSLGDLDKAAIAAGKAPGTITMTFDAPIKNFDGADFVVFENSLASLDGGVFAELAYVEASDDGVTFHRFPSISLTPAPVGLLGTINPTDVYGLAGKHINSGGNSWGTPFDLADVGLEHATHIRIVDIPGDGSFKDTQGDPIYDAWLTFGSGGFDLEAIGAISVEMRYEDWPALAGLPPDQRGPGDDPDGDGLPNLLEYALARDPAKPNPEPPTRIAHPEDGTRQFVFKRDSRLIDLALEIQTSSDLSSWTTLAISTGGAGFVPVDGEAPVITETAAPGIRSVGVIREVRVEMPDNPRVFHRLRATRIEP